MRLLWIVLLAIGLVDVATASSRTKRQIRKRKENEEVQELCKQMGTKFMFRKKGGKSDCKEVFRCVNGAGGKQALTSIKCAPPLVFDIHQQTCRAVEDVDNCDVTFRPILPLPLINTPEPVCAPEQMACSDGECFDFERFCDGFDDCFDGSDENYCGPGDDPNSADICNRADCVLPDCFCSSDGTQIPGADDTWTPTDVPQMITMTFHGAVNVQNIGVFQEIFRDEHKNPNGCTAKGTFFVSHKYTNYSAVQELHRKGHEIGVFSITNNNDPDYWSSGNFTVWQEEMLGARTIIEEFANITDYSVGGVRAPQLRVGGNSQFEMMLENQFLYDSSITAPLDRVPIWPYTLDYRMPHNCIGTSQRCPARSFPLWEMVINEMDLRETPDDDRLAGCHLLSSCANLDKPEEFARVLRLNFDRHYNTNRAPLGLHFTAGWLNERRGVLKELVKFIEEILENKNDAYFVSNSQVISWMGTPKKNNELRDFENWKLKCDVKGLPYCSLPNACESKTPFVKGETFFLNTCMECPAYYPWLNDNFGEGLGGF